MDSNPDELAKRATAKAKKHVAKHNERAPPIRRRIEKALTHEGFLSEAEAREAAFHMTDWIADLQDLNDLFAHSRWNPEKAQEVLLAFLNHAPHHLVAAARIVYDAPVTDVFGIGAVKGTGKPRRKPRGPYPEPPKRAPRRSSGSA